MPACFQLTKRGEKEPSTLHDVDRVICEKLGIECSEKKWAFGWYSIIGLLFAMGKTFDEVREVLGSSELLLVLDVLEENYTVNSWHSNIR